MSGVTMAQGPIAEELEVYDDVMWFTTSYLIAISALSPLSGRLASIFSPRTLVLPMGFFFVAGQTVTAIAHSFAVFILGRVLTGVGGAGVMTLSVILILELVGKERRGIFIGLLNCGFTIGLSSGAIVYGALLPVMGWVCIIIPSQPSVLFESLLTLTGSTETRLRPAVSNRLGGFYRVILQHSA